MLQLCFCCNQCYQHYMGKICGKKTPTLFILRLQVKVKSFVKFKCSKCKYILDLENIKPLNYLIIHRLIEWLLSFMVWIHVSSFIADNTTVILAACFILQVTWMLWKWLIIVKFMPVFLLFKELDGLVQLFILCLPPLCISACWILNLTWAADAYVHSCMYVCMNVYVYTWLNIMYSV